MKPKTLSRAQIEAEEPDDDETNLNDDDDCGIIMTNDVDER
jgi:hypothetical protein